MSELTMAVVLGSTRPGRVGKAVADWVVARAQGRDGASYELLDLADYPLPHLDEPLPPALGQYQNDHTKSGRRRSPPTTASCSSLPSTTTRRRAC